RPAAGQDLRTSGFRALDEALDALALGVRDQWPHLGVVFEWRANLDRTHGRDDRFLRLPDLAALDVDTCGSGTVLAGVHSGGDGGFTGDQLYIGVVEDDERRLAA